MYLTTTAPIARTWAFNPEAVCRSLRGDCRNAHYVFHMVRTNATDIDVNAANVMCAWNDATTNTGQSTLPKQIRKLTSNMRLRTAFHRSRFLDHQPVTKRGTPVDTLVPRAFEPKE